MAAGDLQRGADEERLTPTIFALATGAPPTAIAIVRVSGPQAFGIARQLTRRPMPPARRLVRRVLVDPGSSEAIDDAMIVAFARPASATGDDVVEFHLHGGVAVVDAALSAVRRAGAVPAGPGAMTRRAFDNGKLDLGQVEALGDLIAAESDGQRRAAMARTGTDLARRVDAWRATLLEVRADLEATLDFAEEEGVPAGLTAAARTRLAALAAALVAAQDDAARAGRLRDGMTVAIVGPVNAGKSTLLNALARRDAAMVSPQAGTTRDVIEARIELGGLPITLIDTAGTRASADELEAEGIRRGAARAAAADIVIALGPTERSDAIVIASKCDVTGMPGGWYGGVLHVSAATGAGLEALVAELERRLAALTDGGEPPLIAHRWQVAALQAATASVVAANGASDAVVAAEELRLAAGALERLIGRVGSEVLLDTIFARFCIGK